MIRRLLVPLLVMAVLGASCSSDTDAAAPAVDPLAAKPIGESSALGRSVGDVTMPNAANDGVPFPMRANTGELLVVYFGFTSCPDICPTTLADVRESLELLGDDADKVTVAMVTIDPARDSDETLTAYLRSFVDDGVPLRTTTSSDLDKAVEAFDAEYDVITSADGDVEVFHTAYLYGVDDTGTIRIIWPFGAEPEAISTDVRELLAAN